jgi:kumamolisin
MVGGLMGLGLIKWVMSPLIVRALPSHKIDNVSVAFQNRVATGYTIVVPDTDFSLGIQNEFLADTNLRRIRGEIKKEDAASRRPADIVVDDDLILRPPPLPSVQSARQFYTNYVSLVPNLRTTLPVGQLPLGESPDSILDAYAVPKQKRDAGSGMIGIVGAYNSKNLESDLHVFSQTFHLRECPTADGCLRILNLGSGAVEERRRCNFAAEAVIDVEWAHAMAPRAKLLLVQAKAANDVDLFAAVKTAADTIRANGGGEVSMSIGRGEFDGEGDFDGTFSDGVVYVMATGDAGGVVSYPAASPRVIAVGGTKLYWDADHKLTKEEGWGKSGGGVSKHEPQPHFQGGVENTSLTHRVIPDIAAVADWGSGVAVYNTDVCPGTQPGWIIAGGTSVAAPIVAGRINSSGRFLSSSQAELDRLYRNRKGSQIIRDILSSSPGPNVARRWYDLVTGVGTALGLDFDK